MEKQDPCRGMAQGEQRPPAVKSESVPETSWQPSGSDSMLPTQGAQVQSLVGELRSHTPHGQRVKTSNRNNIVTRFNKDFKHSVQFSSVAQSGPTLCDRPPPSPPWTAARQASLSITISGRLFKLTSIELVMPSNHLILCPPFLPPSIFPSIRVFPNESVLHIGWPNIGVSASVGNLLLLS